MPPSPDAPEIGAGDHRRLPALLRKRVVVQFSHQERRWHIRRPFRMFANTVKLQYLPDYLGEEDSRVG